MIKVMIPFLVLTSLTQTTKDDGMSYLICSKAISGLVYDFKGSTSSPSPVKTLVKTQPQLFENNTHIVKTIQWPKIHHAKQNGS